MRRLISFFLLPALIAVSAPARPAHAKLKVVATIETLADLTRQVGGDRVEVESMSHGYQDPHFVQAKPSLVLHLNRADALVYVGLELEVGWLPPLVLQSRNPRIQQGQPGNIDASGGVKVEDVPHIAADQLRAMGDIHPLGNPHYWIPPDNALGIARLLAARLTALDPAGAPVYQQNLTSFSQHLRDKRAAWEKAAARLRGVRIVTYHKSWSYLAGWLGLVEVGYIEPKPGIPPTANHTAQLIQLMRQQQVKMVIHESFYPSSLANIVADKGGARVVALPSDVGASSAIKTYFDLVDAVIAELTR
jgi:zinc/manganese transport system substrate-binding protein